MEHDLVLEGRVVTPDSILDTEIGVSEGKITEIGRGLHGGRRIKAGRCLIFPGFVDMHVHMREPGWERKEDFRTGTLAAAHGGVTTVVDMPNNPVPTTTLSALEEKVRLAAAKGVVDVRFYGGVDADRLAGLKEIGKDAIGFKIYLSETTGAKPLPESELGGALAAVAQVGRPASLHCEKQSVIDKARDDLKGASAPDLHCDLRPPRAELEAVREVVAALKGVPGGRVNVCHASTQGAVGLVKRARSEGAKAYCEATLHHLYFNRRAMLDEKLLKTNPPLRTEDDRRALLLGLKGGDVSFLVTDHAPHLLSEKLDGGRAGVPGLDDYAHIVSWLIRAQDVDPPTIARVASGNPSKYLHLDDRGEIAVGRRADFTILDLGAPEKVRNDDVQSKCGWSPYEGREFPGRARWTVTAGDVLVDDFELSR